MPWWIRRGLFWGAVSAGAIVPFSILSAMWFSYRAGFSVWAVFGPRSTELWTLILPIGVVVIFFGIAAMYIAYDGFVALRQSKRTRRNS
jgi:hypothetical protein